MELTKDAKKVLYVLYKEYLKRIKSGIARTEAKSFDPDILCQDLFSEYTSDDVNDFLCELGSAGYLDNFFGDGIVQYTTLTNFSIIEMENRFKNGLNDVIDFIAKFL